MKPNFLMMIGTLTVAASLASANMESEYSSEIRKGLAELTSPASVSFFNPKVDQKSLLEEAEKRSELRKSLMASNDQYVCANSYITGFADEPRKSSANDKKIPAGSKATILDDKQIDINVNRTRYSYVKLSYEGGSYWAVKSIGDNDYITSYEDCSKIQSKVFESELAKSNDEIVNQTEDGIPVQTASSSSSLVKYICADTLNVYTTESLRESISLKLGDEVRIMQGNNSTPFTATKNSKAYQFIRFEHNGKAYWGASDFITSYDSCNKLSKVAKTVCSKTANSIKYRKKPVAENVVGNLDIGTTVYHDRGHVYSHKIVKLNGENIKFLPINLKIDSNEVYWIVDSAIDDDSCKVESRNSNISGGKNVKVTKSCRGFDPIRNSSGRITSVSTRNFKYTMNTGDLFPLKKRPIGSYFTGPARFYNNRAKGRKHAATDLYTKTIDHSGRKRGELFYAVQDGTVIAADGFYCGTFELAVRNTDGSVWRYGEIVNPTRTSSRVNKSFRVGQKVKAGDLLGQTLHVGNCARSYPTMLHLEKYNGSKSGSLTAGGNIFSRRHDLENPSCHVQTMEQNKFGRSYANPHR